jgi:unsaturated pyranuronate lyase
LSAFGNVDEIAPQRIWEGIVSRGVHGDKVTLSLIELDPSTTIPEHSHENEQVGIMLHGSMTFRIGDETKEVRRGATWCIPAHEPHEVQTGPDGAVVVEVWSPPRTDWSGIAPEEPHPPRWPAG